MLRSIIFCLLSLNSIRALTIDEEIREAVEGFKALMTKGSSALGLPPLAPYQNDFLELTIENTSIKYDI